MKTTILTTVILFLAAMAHGQGVAIIENGTDAKKQIFDTDTANYHAEKCRMKTEYINWTGAVSVSWHNAGNWSSGQVPNATVNVNIPSGTPFSPAVLTNNASCKNLVIYPGAKLNVYDKTLTVNANLTVSGTLGMLQGNGTVTIMGNAVWGSGASLNVTAINTFIEIYGNWNFGPGSTVNPGMGYVDFMGNGNSWIRCYSGNSSFHNLRIFKTDGAFTSMSDLSTNDLVINGFTRISTTSNFLSASNYNIIMKGSFNYYGTFDFTAFANTGSVFFAGNMQFINNYNSSGSGIFNNVVFKSTTGTTVVNGDIHVAGELAITQGFFSPGANKVYVGGDWLNTVGSSGFTEAETHVVFNGDNHQYCSDETFHTLEIDKPTGVHFRISGSNVTCAHYDWVAGVVSVLDEGIFTANNLLDNGIYGIYHLNSGSTINLHNYDGWVDLCGELYIFDGTFNVYGGTLPSYWPFMCDAMLNMSGGVLDFKDQGIHIPNPGPSTFIHNITGGLIRTSGGFSCDNPGFSMAGTIELYGPGSHFLSLTEEVLINNLVVNKLNEEKNAENNGMPLFDERSGIMISDGSKADRITLGSDITVYGNLDIMNGALNMGVYSMLVAQQTQIHGKLEMTNETNELTSPAISWHHGSAADVTAGSFWVAIWTFYEGADVVFSNGNTAYVFYNLIIDDHDATFGNLRYGGFFKEAGNHVKARGITTSSGTLRTAGFYTVIPGFWAGGVENIDHVIGGAFTIGSGASYVLEACNINVDGEIDLQGSLYIKDEAEVVVHGGVNFPSGGALHIQGGSFVADHPEPVPPNWTNMNGVLNISEGLFELTNNHPRFNPSAITDISGGIIRTGGSFEAAFPGGFQPTGGMVELAGNGSGVFEFLCANGNHFHNLMINRAAPTSVYLPEDLIIKNDLIIQNGQFSMHPDGGDLFIGGNWINNVGADGFLPLETTVVFNGSTAQTCSAEEFYRLSINKPEGKVTFPSLTTCEIYDWQSGGIIVNGGAFTAYNLQQCGIRGSYTVSSEGTINLFQNKNKTVDLFADIKILSGTINIYGGFPESGSLWPATTYASLYMSGGVLDIKDQHIHIQNTGTFPNNVFGGTIRTSKGYLGERTDFQPSGGTFEFYGPDNAFIFQSNGSTLHNVLINKDLEIIEKNTHTMPEAAEKGDGFAKSASIELFSDITITNDLEIALGTMSINSFVATVEGNTTLNPGSKLHLQGYGTLVMGNNRTLSVMEGAELQLTGDGEYYTKITSTSGRYALNVENGGILGAEFAIFEFMDVNGVNIKPGGIIDPARAFSNCIFRNGHVAGRLLTLNNEQALTINNASFPTITGGFNVSKLHNTGVVTFVEYKGAFAGSTYEQDPYNRVHWNDDLSSFVSLEGVMIIPWQEICFEASETISVGGVAPFEAMPASTVSLVAGQSIIMLPGTHAHQGSNLRAWISDGTYCSGQSLLITKEEIAGDAFLSEKATEVPADVGFPLKNTSIHRNIEAFFRIYPNPTPGLFTLELLDYEQTNEVVVHIFSMCGTMLQQHASAGERQLYFDLSGQPAGVYFVRVMAGGRVEVRRVVKRM